MPIFGSKTRVKVGYFSNIAQFFCKTFFSSARNFVSTFITWGLAFAPVSVRAHDNARAGIEMGAQVQIAPTRPNSNKL